MTKLTKEQVTDMICLIDANGQGPGLIASEKREYSFLFIGEGVDLQDGVWGRFLSLHITDGKKYLCIVDTDHAESDSPKDTVRVSESYVSGQGLFSRMAEQTGGYYHVERDVNAEGIVKEYNHGCFVPFSFFDRIKDSEQMKRFLGVCSFNDETAIEYAFSYACGD